jgi:hypothetical protein
MGGAAEVQIVAFGQAKEFFCEYPNHPGGGVGAGIFLR